MADRSKIDELHKEMTDWRRDLHAHPETAFEEHRTSDFIAGKLEEFGIEVVRGLAGTGLVGVLKSNGRSGKAIGLRADMDALHIDEQTNLPYSSKTPGKMHACGHDGHVTMLLGAAKYLSKTRDFDGTAYFIFQPAEECEGGAKVMIEEGLFEKFQMDSVYGMHNWPGMPIGQIGTRPGPVMAAFDIFEIKITGKGSHAAMPHQSIDAVVIACMVVSSLQTVASRVVDTRDPVVVSVTQIHAGDTWNVIPEEAVIRGTVRSFNAKVRDLSEETIKKIAKGVCAAHGAECDIRYERRYPPTINTEQETVNTAKVAEKLVGAENVRKDMQVCMGSEDFAYMLQKRPGSYIWLGAGDCGGNLHNPNYDFNDEILPLGASYWAELVEDLLPESAN
jgi:hippurate hydrolase